MFAAIIGEYGEKLGTSIRAMRGALQGTEQTAQLWSDEKHGFAVFGTSSGCLPEDVYDTQPYVTEHLCFVASGRVDNRDEVADLLSISAGDLKVKSDSAILFASYCKWGAHCGSRLAGQYSFCAIHRDAGHVVVGADHVASSMVLYANVNDQLLVANQLGVLLAHPLLEQADIDIDATACLVAARSPSGRTAFRDIKPVLGGRTIHWRKGGAVQEHRWWNVKNITQNYYQRPYEYVEHAQQVFSSAIRGCLRSSGPLSATLSGGLDSSLVAGTAAKILSTRGEVLGMYTSVPDSHIPSAVRTGWDADEGSLASELATIHPNTTHTLISPCGSILQTSLNTHQHSYTPVRNTANQLWLRTIVEQVREKGSRVLLMGERGNATISFSGFAVLDRLFSTNPFIWLRLARSEARSGGIPIWKLALREFRNRAMAGARATPIRYGARYLRSAVADRSAALLNARAPELRFREGQEQFATSTVRTWKRDVLAHSGVELRSPTEDKRLIEMALSIPIEAHFACGQARGLARELGKGVVPDSIRLRRRHGAQVPEHSGLIALHGKSYRNALASLSDSPACREFFHLDIAQTDLARLCAGEINLAAAATIDRLLDVGLFWKARGL